MTRPVPWCSRARRAVARQSRVCHLARTGSASATVKHSREQHLRSRRRPRGGPRDLLGGAARAPAAGHCVKRSATAMSATSRRSPATATSTSGRGVGQPADGLGHHAWCIRVVGIVIEGRATVWTASCVARGTAAALGGSAMRLDRPVVRECSGTTLAGGGALQAVLARLVSGAGRDFLRSSHTGLWRPPLALIRHSLESPGATAFRHTDSVARRPPRCFRPLSVQELLQLLSCGTRHPNKEARVDCTLVPVYDRDDQAGREVVSMPTWPTLPADSEPDPRQLFGKMKIARLEGILENANFLPRKDKGGGGAEGMTM